MSNSEVTSVNFTTLVEPAAKLHLMRVEKGEIQEHSELHIAVDVQEIGDGLNTSLTVIGGASPIALVSFMVGLTGKLQIPKSALAMALMMDNLKGESGNE